MASVKSPLNQLALTTRTNGQLQFQMVWYRVTQYSSHLLVLWTALRRPVTERPSVNDPVFSSWTPSSSPSMSASSNSYGSTCSRSGSCVGALCASSVLSRCKAPTVRSPYRTTAATAASTCCSTSRASCRTLWCTLNSPCA